MMPKSVTWRWMGFVSAVLGVLGAVLTPTCAAEVDEVDAVRDAKICWANLHAIEAAKEMNSLENACAPGDVIESDDLVGDEYYLTEVPICPSKLPYLIMPIGCPPVCTSGLPGHSILATAIQAANADSKTPNPLGVALAKYPVARRQSEIGEVLWEVVRNHDDSLVRAMSVLAIISLEPSKSNVFDIPRFPKHLADLVTRTPGTTIEFADQESKARFDLANKILAEFLAKGGAKFDWTPRENYFESSLDFSAKQVLDWNRSKIPPKN